MYLHVCVCVCRERVRVRDFIFSKREREATLKGGSCGSCSGPQRLGPQRKAGLLKRTRMGGGVYFGILFSVFNAHITIKKLQLISYIYERALQAAEHRCEHTTGLTYVFYLEHKI